MLKLLIHWLLSAAALLVISHFLQASMCWVWSRRW